MFRAVKTERIKMANEKITGILEEIKALIKNGDYDEVVAVLDKAILDFATLG